MRPALFTAPGLAQVQDRRQNGGSPDARAYIRPCMSGDIQQEPT
jgi:hypothetical protein